MDRDRLIGERGGTDCSSARKTPRQAKSAETRSALISSVVKSFSSVRGTAGALCAAIAEVRSESAHGGLTLKVRSRRGQKVTNEVMKKIVLFILVASAFLRSLPVASAAAGDLDPSLAGTGQLQIGFGRTDDHGRGVA